MALRYQVWMGRDVKNQRGVPHLWDCHTYQAQQGYPALCGRRFGWRQGHSVGVQAPGAVVCKQCRKVEKARRGETIRRPVPGFDDMEIGMIDALVRGADG